MIINFANLGSGGGGDYRLPIASDTRLGGVKIGEGIVIASDGTISVSGGSEALTIELENYGPNDFTREEISAMTSMANYLQQFDENNLPPARIYIGGCYYTLSAFENIGDGNVIYAFTHVDPLGVTDPTAIATFFLNPNNLQASHESFKRVQRSMEAADVAEMDELEAVEGDVCVVGEHFDVSDDLQVGLDNGWGFSSCWWSIYNVDGAVIPSAFRFTLVENQYWDGQDPTSMQNGNNDLFYYQSDDSTWYGIACDNGEFKYINGVVDANQPQIADYTTFTGVGDSFIIETDNFDINGGGGSGADTLYEHQTNTNYKYVVRIEAMMPNTTYQYNNGEWIKLADMSDVAEAKQIAQNAQSMASTKFNLEDVYTSGSEDVLQRLQFSPSGAYKIFKNVDGQWDDKGLMFHTNGTTGETDNKYLRELVVSQAVSKIVSLTQTEYDALTTYDSTVLYVIIPDPNA